MTDRNMNEQDDLTGGLGRDRQPQQEESKSNKPLSYDDAKTKKESEKQASNGDYKPSEYSVAEKVKAKTAPVEFVNGIYYKTANGHYQCDDNEYKKIIYQMSDVKKPNFIEAVLKLIKMNVTKLDYNQNFPVRFNNGILKDGKFKECDYQHFTPYVVNLTYSPDAEAVPIVDDYLDFITVDNKNYRSLIEEIMGYTLETDIERISHLAKVFFIVGEGLNGKGTLLKLIGNVLGSHNTSSLDLKKMRDLTYTSALKGSLVNLADDAENEKIGKEEIKLIKNIATGDLFTIRGMYKDPEEVRLKTTLVFTTNHILESVENSKAIKRRYVWLPLYRVVPNDDPTFFKKLTSEKAKLYWARLFVEGYMRLHENNKFTHCQIVEDFTNEYHEKSDNTIQFCKEKDVSDIEFKTVADVHEEYESWCYRDGLEARKSSDLKKTILSHFDMDYKQSRKVSNRQRTFIKKD